MLKRPHQGTKTQCVRLSQLLQFRTTGHDSSWQGIFNQINKTEREFLLSVLSKLSQDFSLPTSFDREPVFITVEDNGIGMTKEEQKNIWGRYYRADSSSKNTKIDESGLELSIVKELVHLHHSSIEVTSRKNEGTTFLIQFPKEK